MLVWSRSGWYTSVMMGFICLCVSRPNKNITSFLLTCNRRLSRRRYHWKRLGWALMDCRIRVVRLGTSHPLRLGRIWWLPPSESNPRYVWICRGESPLSHPEPLTINGLHELRNVGSLVSKLSAHWKIMIKKIIALATENKKNNNLVGTYFEIEIYAKIQSCIKLKTRLAFICENNHVKFISQKLNFNFSPTHGWTFLSCNSNEVQGEWSVTY